MAVRVIHKLQHHPLGVARRTAPKARTHAGPCAVLAHTPNRSWHSAAPSSPSSHDRGAAGLAARHRWHVACSGRSWSRCSRSSAAPTSRSARPPLPTRPSPSPVPQIDQGPVRARRAVEGAHAAQHARRGRERAQPARLVVPVRVRHELAPQRRAQVRPHLPGEAGARRAHERAPALRGAPPREARERGRGAGRGAGGGGEGRA